jgi:hypothetical protein
MARSLVVQHEEGSATSPLFTGFLLFSVLFLLFAAWSTSATADVGPADPGPVLVTAP